MITNYSLDILLKNYFTRNFDNIRVSTFDLNFLEAIVLSFDGIFSWSLSWTFLFEKSENINIFVVMCTEK